MVELHWRKLPGRLSIDGGQCVAAAADEALGVDRCCGDYQKKVGVAVGTKFDDLVRDGECPGKSFYFAGGALGAAGHRVADPEARTILARHSRGEISGDEARALIFARHGVAVPAGR